MSKDTFYSVTPVNWLLRIVALSNIYREESQLQQSGSKIKSAIYISTLGIINLCILYDRIHYFQGNINNGFLKFSDAIQVAYWVSYLEYIIDMYHVFKFGRFMLLRYFKVYNHIDSILGMSCYEEIRKIIIVTIVISAIIFCFISLFDYVAWVLGEGWWLASTICVIDYWYFSLGMLTIFDVVTHVIQVEYRLKNIRLLLQNTDSSNIIDCFNQDIKIIVSASPNDNKHLSTLQTLCSTKYLETAWFTRCYLLLLEQVDYINTSYGFRVLVYCVNLLNNMINMLNLSIRIFNGSMPPANNTTAITFISSIASTMRAVNYAVMVSILMYRCEQVYTQSEKLLEIIDVLLTSKENRDGLKKDLLEFRGLIITRPVRFHAAKFFTMDYTVLVSLCSVVVTYTIIMLQSMQ